MPARLFSRSAVLWCLGLSLAASLTSCGDDDAPMRRDGGLFEGGSPIIDGGFVCISESAQACLGTTYYSCVRDGEFLRSNPVDCAAMGMLCVPDLWCVVCRPREVGCFEGNAAVCRDDGSGWDITETCDIGMGFVCRDGTCQNLCALAIADRSYLGCEFYATDLDNAGLAAGRDASAQQYSVVVSNPGTVQTDVVVERNDAPVGSPPTITEVERVTVMPGQLEVFNLERRELDGSSSNRECLMESDCPVGETCVTVDMTTGRKVCRVSATASGINDGTHTALTSNAYRVRSVLPIIAYQFNPLDNVGVFSNDASLLLPTSAIDRDYTVVTWPQTIANSTNPAQDFDPRVTDEDLRTFLTIVGTQESTTVHLQLGTRVVKVVGAGPIPTLGGSGVIDLTIGPFDVINLETEGFNADFTGTIVSASSPVAVFVGSEASDSPRFDDLAQRRCCADHLEEQLFPDSTLGRRFMIGRDASRSKALNGAFVDPRDHVAEPNEPEWVRVVAASVDATTTLSTTLPPPDDHIELMPRQDIIIRADQDFLLDSDQPIAVMLVSPSQEAVGIPNNYPGGDPFIVAVPPIEQYRQDYVFLTPDLYAFDFVTIMANTDANILFDGRALSEMVGDDVTPSTPCTVSAADGIVRMPADPPPERVVYRCQLGFPDVSVDGARVRVTDGIQNDGVHTLIADQPVGLIVSGWDSFVSYGYTAGLNLQAIN